MAIAWLVNEEDTFRIYRNSKGKLFKFILEDEFEILIEDMDGNAVGKFEFQDNAHIQQRIIKTQD